MLVVAFLVGDDNGGGSTAAPTTSAPPGPLTTTVPAPAADVEKICDPVLAKMPVTINGGDEGVLQPLVVTPGGPTFLAWGNPLVTLQCGVGRPAPLTDSSGYVPYAIGPTDGPGASWLIQEGGDRDTWTTIDRSVYFRVTLPHADVGYLTDISGVIGAALPAVCKGPVEAGDPPDTLYCGSRP